MKYTIAFRKNDIKEALLHYLLDSKGISFLDYSAVSVDIHSITETSQHTTIEEFLDIVIEIAGEAE